MTSKFFQVALSTLVLGAAALGAGSAEAHHRDWSYRDGNSNWKPTTVVSKRTTTPMFTINNGQPVFDSTGRLIINHNMLVPPQPPKPIVPMHF
jgi:hypothetical protein